MRGIYWKLYQLQYKDQEIERREELATQQLQARRSRRAALIAHFGGLKVRLQARRSAQSVSSSCWRCRFILSVIPLFSEHIDSAQQRELQMVSQIFGGRAADDDEPAIASELSIYDLREGTAAATGLSAEGQQFLDEHPAGTWQQGRTRCSAWRAARTVTGG